MAMLQPVRTFDPTTFPLSTQVWARVDGRTFNTLGVFLKRRLMDDGHGVTHWCPCDDAGRPPADPVEV